MEFKMFLINEKSVSDNTLQSYMRDINSFVEYYSKPDVYAYSEISVDDLRAYITHMDKKGRSSATITRNIASIRCFYQFLIFNGYVDHNPAKRIKREKETKKKPNVLSSDEIKLLLAQPNTRDSKGCRDKAMLELLYATGIKVSELINLDVNDINLKSGILICKNNRNIRVIPIYHTALESVSTYINRVRKTMLSGYENDTQALFLNLNGKRLTRQGFWKIIKSYAACAQIDKDITPLTLRHSFAIHLLENGADLKDIKDMLGHADIASTQIYAEILSERIKDVYNRYHPMASSKET